METQKKSIHLINELPHISELENMMNFCSKYEKIYIYGRSEYEEYLLKYFDMAEVEICGFVLVDVHECDKGGFIYRNLPVISLKKFLDKSKINACIIMSENDYHYENIISEFKRSGFEDYFLMTEFNKRAIAKQMTPRKCEELGFEISLADHCNLSCQMCDHYSQLSKPWFVNMKQFDDDICQMGKIFDHKIGAISLLGGEPTLHEDLIDCIKIVRREFPDTELIILTNGIKLLELENSPKGNLWQVCKDYDVHITVTVYPIKIDYEAIEKKAAEYGVPLGMSSNIHAEEFTKAIKISDKHTMDMEGKVDKFYCVNCLYYNKFNVLKDGRYYMCPVAAHSNILNEHFGLNLKLQEKDSLDIYKVTSWEEIAEFSSKWVPFCRYCDLKKWGHHSEWKPSTKKLDEYFDIDLTETTGGLNTELEITRSELKRYEEQFKMLNNKLSMIENDLHISNEKYENAIHSLSYNIGRGVTYLPRKIRKIVKNMRR